MKIIHAPPSPEAVAILKALQTAVSNCLVRKKTLGQYAVLWRNGRPIKVGDLLQKGGE